MQTFSWPIRIYYEDTDAGGVVYYANYLKFFERARTEMLRAIGYEQDALRTTANVIFVVRSVQLDYLSPARFNDLLEVSTTIAEVKRTQIFFDQLMTRDAVTLCRTKIGIACLNATTMRPTAIPQPLLEQLQNEN
ncbi:MAG: tol-pal system-associated acyl-CoA thioesterase [Methylococcales bacterium]|nr:tol-pal system-associated acyl-CoA thioesterase [Methylococcales bacterium]